MLTVPVCLWDCVRFTPGSGLIGLAFLGCGRWGGARMAACGATVRC